jgi:hypothetical protein
MKRIASIGLGKLSVLVTLASVLFVFVAFGQNMFSSGPLNVENRRNDVRGGVKSHAEASCSACHAPAWSGETMSIRCMNCHENIRDQLDGSKPLHGLMAQGQDCMSCHTEHKGPHASLTSLAKFDHECAAFKLVGKHKQAECAACHKEQLYQQTPQACAACHAEPAMHKDKFGADCMSCHTPHDWHAATLLPQALTAGGFNHDHTRFKLTGKHVTADCKSCHASNTFKGTPTSCVSCHVEPVSHKPHPKTFGENCASCHSTLAWKGATLAKHTFPMNHRTKDRKNSACAVCHQDKISLVSTTPAKLSPSYTTYSCYGCHQHTPEREAGRRSHRKVTNLNACAKCHPTGRGEERRRTGLDESVDFCLAFEPSIMNLGILADITKRELVVVHEATSRPGSAIPRVQADGLFPFTRTLVFPQR